VTKPDPLPLVQGTLDLLVLQALASGPTHGYGIATLVHQRTDGHILQALSLKPLHGYGVLLRIGQISKGALHIPQGSLYPALYRLERQGLIRSEWKVTENNRRARYYTLTPDGRKRLCEETANWRRYARAVDALLAGA